MLSFLTFIGVVGFKTTDKVNKNKFYDRVRFVSKFATVDRPFKVKTIFILSGLLFICFGLLPGFQAKAQANGMVVDSFDGPVTQNEINSFKSYIQTLQPVVWPNTSSMQSEYAQGKTGESIKAMGLMYEITGDTAILDRMIYFDDVLLSERNDILAAPNGQRTVWTNTIAPVWPGNTTDPASADSANGDPVGHLAYCARLILQNPSIWNTPVAGGDLYGHGVTYKQRALTFLTESDQVVSQFFLSSLLDLSNGNKYYFSSQSPYMTGAVMPWNQQMMISYGLENLAAAHAIIGDNPSLVSKYDGIVQANLNWFFSDNSAKQTYTDSAGNTAYNWGYNPTLLGGEDSNHGSLDVAGFYRAYLIGRYGITSSMLQPFANMYSDVMMQGPRFFAGRVDGTNGTGHGSPTTYVRSGNLFLADLRPDKYYDLVSPDLTPSGTTTSMDTFSRFIWAKNQRQNEGYSIGFSPAPGPSTAAQTITLSSYMSGASIRYTINGSTPSATNGTLYTGPFTVTSTTTVKAIAYTTSTTSLVSTGTYSIWAAAPTLSPAGGTYSTSQSVTMSSSTSGASIRYTTDGSTPSTTNGTLYSGPVTVSANATLRAIAYTSGLSPSNITTTGYTIGSYAAAPTLNPGGGTYSSAQTVTISTSTPGASIKYTTDGSTPSSTAGTLYSGPIAISSGTDLKAVAYASGMSDSPVTSASYTIGTVATPTFSVVGGTYPSAQTVALGTTTPGATILFTTDGSSPTSGTGMVYVYTGPFTVSQNMTVQAYAYAPNLNNSPTASATYAIQAAAAQFSPAGGTYNGTQLVTISSATTGASIRYTTDGSTPTETSGTLYSAPVTISASTTLKAIAYASGMTDSAVTSAVYTITTSSLPSGWTDTDIGSPGLAGSASYNSGSGTFTVNGSGADIYGTSDQFNYAYSSVGGDFTVTSRIASQTNTNNWAKSGVMIRETTGATSNYVGIYVTPVNGVDMQYRSSTGGSATDLARVSGVAAPYWVRLVRSGNTFTGYCSADGVTWTQVGSISFSMASNALTGLAVSSHDNTKLNTSTFDNVSIKAAAPTFSPTGGSYNSAQTITISSATSGASIRYTTDGSTPSETNGTLYSGAITVNSTTTLKAIAYKSGDTDSLVNSATYSISPTLTGLDIGTPPLAGSTSFSNGTYTVSGSGADIYGTSDQFQYAYESKTGDMTITARVASQTNTNNWAKAGVMIRETTGATSTYVGIYVTPSNGVDMQYRASTGGSAADLARVSGAAAPYWVRLVRSGNTFTGYCSADGVTWTQVGSISVAMGSSVTVGLPVSSHSTTALSTATFDNFSIQ